MKTIRVIFYYSHPLYRRQEEGNYYLSGFNIGTNSKSWNHIHYHNIVCEMCEFKHKFKHRGFRNIIIQYLYLQWGCIKKEWEWCMVYDGRLEWWSTLSPMNEWMNEW